MVFSTVVPARAPGNRFILITYEEWGATNTHDSAMVGITEIEKASLACQSTAQVRGQVVWFVRGWAEGGNAEA